MRWLLLIALGACYRPSADKPCRLSCATSDDCPSSLACNNNLCTLPDNTCGDDPDDATVVLPDGIDPLPTGCAGTTGGLMPNACFTPLPGVVALGGPFDTRTDARCLVTEPQHCIVIAEAITISSSLAVIGDRVLVLWSASTIEVTPAGTIDVASRADGKRGPGTIACNGGSGNTITDGGGNASGSGGGGGSHATGGGGAGGIGRTLLGQIGSDGAQPSVSEPSLRGGCDGAEGGSSPGSGGAGGGGVYLMANSLILISGTVNASGAPGAGGTLTSTYGGGGGGGSGGLIGLDAPFVQVKDAHLIAVGGGGGSGAASNGGEIAGMIGRDVVANPFDPGGPGGQTVLANAGGAGSQSTAVGGAGGDVSNSLVGGGGGGGGGRGFVVWFGTTKDESGATIAPPLVP